MAGIKCIHCNYIGILEKQASFFDDKACDMPISRVFKHKGHNPFTGNLHYECSQCKTTILVDPMDVLGIVGYEILTDVREKPRGKSFFAWFSFNQEEDDLTTAR
jgi:hypothetical protein